MTKCSQQRSYWDFSIVLCIKIESHRLLGNLVSLSEQQLVECDSYDSGCRGGLPERAFRYLERYGSISEKDYPYTSGNGRSGSCKYYNKKIAATVRSYVQVCGESCFCKFQKSAFKTWIAFKTAKGNEAALQQAVGTVGPVCVGIDASHYSFQMYSGGVYYEHHCSSYNLDHAVLVAGYGNYYGQAYWLVKNSWGTRWGVNGYIMMSRDKGNNCGIATDAGYPLV